MAADTETVMQITKEYANIVRNAMPIDKVFLYGSYAKGTATELSDVDVCFFLDFGKKQREDIMLELLGLIHEHKKAAFEPIAFPTSEIQNDNPFVKEILRTGVEIV
jgi:predicted nucleotidyltransferase